MIPLLAETNHEGLQLEHFVQGTDNQLDVLFVVSNTTTMQPYQDRLRAAIPGWIAQAKSRGVDLRVGVTTTGLVTRSTTCPGGAAGGEAGRLFPVDGMRAPDRLSATSGAATALQQNLAVGVCHNLVQGLETMRQALSSPLIDRGDDPRTAEPNDGNLGMLRDQARLAVVVLSDEDDHSGFDTRELHPVPPGAQGPGHGPPGEPLGDRPHRPRLQDRRRARARASPTSRAPPAARSRTSARPTTRACSTGSPSARPACRGTSASRRPRPTRTTVRVRIDGRTVDPTLYRYDAGDQRDRLLRRRGAAARPGRGGALPQRLRRPVAARAPEAAAANRRRLGRGGFPSSAPSRYRGAPRVETFGRYELLRKLATGGMGQIYLARQTGPSGFQKLLVVKRILPHLAEEPEFIQMFFDEARIAALLNHPNIAQIYDLGDVDGVHFIAMEYVHGESVQAPRPAAPTRARGEDPDRAQVPDHRRRRRRARRRAPGEEPLGPAALAHPPRRLAAEHPRRLQREREADRLRGRQGRREDQHHDDRGDQGQVRVHVARAGPRAGPRSPRRTSTGSAPASTSCSPAVRLFKRESDSETLKAVVGAKVAAPVAGEQGRAEGARRDRAPGAQPLARRALPDRRRAAAGDRGAHRARSGSPRPRPTSPRSSRGCTRRSSPTTSSRASRRQINVPSGSRSQSLARARRLEPRGPADRERRAADDDPAHRARAARRRGRRRRARPASRSPERCSSAVGELPGATFGWVVRARAIPVDVRARWPTSSCSPARS